MDNLKRDHSQAGSVPRTPFRRFWLFALVPAAVLVWGGFGLQLPSPQNPWRQRLAAFRAEAGADPPVGYSLFMSDVMIVRNSILRSMTRHEPIRLSAAQDRLLSDCLNGPVDERSQSEALDVLLLAQRAGGLSPAEARIAEEECVNVLSRTPAPMVRLEGARFLAHSKSPRAIAALRRLQNDPISKIRDAANQARRTSVPSR